MPDPRILGWTTAYWHTEEEARGRLQNDRTDSRHDHPLIGLQAWKERMLNMLHPIGLFFSSGTYSNPEYNWVSGVEVVNAGAINTGPYEGHYRHYGKCAWTAAMAYAMNRTDWEILACMDTDALFGAIDLDGLVRDFWKRPEIICCPGWGGDPGGPLILQKREAVSRLLHNREIGNLRDPEQTPAKHLWESELSYIFRPLPDGTPRWMNPWPDHYSLIYDPKPEADLWPLVSKFGGDVEFAKRFFQTQSCQTKPYLPDWL